MEIFCLALAAVLVTACASAPLPDNQRVIAIDARLVRSSGDALGSTDSLSLSSDKVWDALMVVYPRIGIQVRSMNRGKGEIGNLDFNFPHSINGKPVSTYLNCGTDPMLGPNANAYPVKASIKSQVISTGATTQLRTTFSAVTSRIGQSDKLSCSSTGVLEGLLVTMVRNQYAQ